MSVFLRFTDSDSASIESLWLVVQNWKNSNTYLLSEISNGWVGVCVCVCVCHITPTRLVFPQDRYLVIQLFFLFVLSMKSLF